MTNSKYTGWRGKKMGLKRERKREEVKLIDVGRAENRIEKGGRGLTN